ncbi:unnamed protein product [Vitrella brassicaformis CCMP3155]|uniref:Amino acid transporter transmembrane domain-containing protein n=1 Tax=Vitrella brassicaformis (strain CCMP3155) TaxID=1169540 RepID=A0A0G4EK49_VITBC|nr:unnamed protein product [Vitrella brassicaformis CCMP3155]|eukprot:CEL96896.1 unnamed protein product [Vitrella brassicaformis CCMP3155]
MDGLDGHDADMMVFDQLDDADRATVHDLINPRGAFGTYSPFRVWGGRRTTTLDSVEASLSPIAHVRRHDSSGSVADSSSYEADQTVMQATFTISNGVIGVGILAVPFAFAASGFISVVFCGLLTVFYGYTGLLIARCMSRTMDYGKEHRIPRIAQDWPLIGRVAFGQVGQTIVTASLTLEIWFVLISYLVLVGANLNLLVPSLSRMVSIISSGILALALIFCPLQWVSMVSLVSNVATAAAVVALVWSAASLPMRAPTDELIFINWRGLPTTIGIVNFCFVAHAVFPTVYASMRKPRRGFPLACFFSFLVAFFSYCGTGLFAYLFYGDSLGESFTENLGRDLQGHKIPGVHFLPLIATAAIVVKLEGGFPLFAAPFLLKTEQWLGLDKVPPPDSPIQGPAWKDPRVVRTLWRAGFMAVSTLLAVLVRDHVADIQAFTGCLFSMQTCCIFPVVFYWKMTPKIPLLERVALASLLCFGVFVVVAGTGLNVLKLCGVDTGVTL